MGQGQNRSAVTHGIAGIALNDRHGARRATAIVDEGDLAAVLDAGRWYLTAKGAATRGGLLLHRFVAGLIAAVPPGAQVRPVSGNRLDCRRGNLAVLDPFAAVHRARRRNVVYEPGRGWRVRFRVAGHRFYLPGAVFQTEAEALAAADTERARILACRALDANPVVR